MVLGHRYIIGAGIIFALLSFLLISGNVRQKVVTLHEGQLAEETIRANKTIENKKDTEAKRKLAAEAVSLEYTFNKELVKKQGDLVTHLFKMITEVKEESNKAKAKNGGEDVAMEDKLASLKKKFETGDQDDVPYYQGYSTGVFETLFNLGQTDFDKIEKYSVDNVKKIMGEPIRETQLDAIKQKAISDVENSDLDSTLKSVASPIMERTIVSNEAANEKRTEELRAQASENVAPSMIYQGEVIVREGVQIDQAAIQKLDSLGLTNRKQSVFPLVALALVILIQVGVLAYIVYHTPGMAVKVRLVTFYGVMMIVGILLMKGFQMLQSESLSAMPFLFPAAFTPLVLNLFINRRASIIGAIFQVMFALFIYYDLLGTSTLLLIAVMYMFTGLMAPLVQRDRIGRQLKAAAVWLIALPMLAMLVMVTYQGMEFSDNKTITILIFSLVGCVFTFVTSVGLHPYIELLLNDDSMIVLNELSNPNHPLLKKLLVEAPGTYHHSMMVASLSANAVADIGGRSLLTRVGCYYHDIGKIKHANFFVENLPDGAENPHNFLLPEDSKEIIFSHVSEGVKILEKEKMPQMVIDICQQHHGTTLMSYFYAKAKERNPEVTEEDFRYAGPRPQTKEAGVVSLADTCEAAVRAMDHPTNEKIRKFVNNLIEKRLIDGQLDDTGLTMKEIRIVEESLINGLCSTFHSRIKYPKMQSEAEKMKKEQEESN
ncbi:HDIG domain-containing protein [Vagococcus coleopterorum]|uniref:HDIG domain-containing protein n=2 Tax=Vagococcus coleopterorum TaxID=2714946 RepID=A0A6G8AQ24_9ENTE|nr:HDIG domain-containing protein [Vagococcus coleopterorum]